MKGRAIGEKLDSLSSLCVSKGSLTRAIGLAIGSLVLVALTYLAVTRIPEAYRSIAAFEGETEPAQHTIRQGLAVVGIPEVLYVAVAFVRYLLVGVGFILAGLLILWRYPWRRELLLSFTYLIVYGLFLLTPPGEDLLDHPLVAFAANLSFAAIFFIFYLFPDGHFVPGWSRWILLAWITSSVGISFFEGTAADPNAWPPWLSAPLWTLMILSGPAAIIFRYKRRADALQKRQIRLVVYGGTIVAVCFLAYWIPLGLFPELISSPRNAALYDLVGGTLSYISLLSFPLSMTIAVLRTRLWDVKPVVNRTLVYGSLTLCVIGIYVAIVGYFAYFLQVRNNLLVSLLATAVVAVTFQPLRETLQRKVNRLLYGLRDDPYQALTSLGHRLELVTSVDELLIAIVTTIREALGLSYVALAIREQGSFAIKTSVGQAQEVVERLPIFHQLAQIGELIFSGRTGDDALSSLDRRLLADLLRQAGIAIQVVRNTLQLRQINQELHQARIQLVTAREEERRRLGRDLHDDLGSMLASINFRAGALKLQLAQEPGIVEESINELQEMIRNAISNLRLLARELRPPVLDELGFREAIIDLTTRYNAREGSHRLGTNDHLCRTVVAVDDHLPVLPAAVELAAYRIIQEALANAHAHADGRLCRLSIHHRQANLQIEIADDGHGLPESLVPGVGIQAMRERAAELGGSLVIERNQHGGTTVRACLPLVGEDSENYDGNSCLDRG